MKHGKNKKNAHWDAGFLFLGNQLTLDLLNTRPAPMGAPIELLSNFHALLQWLHTTELLTRSQASHLQGRWGRSARARRVIRTIRGLRETLRQEILRWEKGRSIRPAVVRQLNVFMARHPMHTKLTARAGELTARTCFDARRPEDLLAPLAHSAAALFTGAPRRRVRQCANCVLHFLDTSKKGTRRWCSMKLCGNRFKVAAYASRQRQHDRQWLSANG